MKKLLILLSTFFLSFFFAWIIVLRAPQYLYASYDSVSLLRVKKEYSGARRVRYLNRNWRILQTQNRV